jgi:hypothetical protein
VMEVITAIHHFYPRLALNNGEDEVHTAWTAVDLPKTDTEVGVPGGTKKVMWFIRFQVKLIGPRPYRIRVNGQVALWDDASATPKSVSEDRRPEWFPDKVAQVRALIHGRLEQYLVP